MDKEELSHQSISNQKKSTSKEALQENLPLEQLDQISKSVPELSIKIKCKRKPTQEQVQRYNAARRKKSEKLREEHKAIAKQMLKIIEDKHNENVVCDQSTSHQSRCIPSEIPQQNASSDYISILPKVSTESLVNKIVKRKRTQEQTDRYNAARRKRVAKLKEEGKTVIRKRKPTEEQRERAKVLRRKKAAERKEEGAPLRAQRRVEADQRRKLRMRIYWNTKRTPEQKEKRNAKLRNTEITEEQREKRNAAQRVSALTVEQHERRKARQKVHLMTAEQIEKKRACAKLYKECQKQRKTNKPRVISSSDDEI